MKYGYTIVYVPDVAVSLAFFEKAFGFERRFMTEEGDYGELETGGTTISFASHKLAESNSKQGFVYCSQTEQPLGVELAFITDDVEKAHATALEAGAIEIAAPKRKPWGQSVSYLRCPDGSLVELCTALS
ncbi:VOC family protein [Verminephrobacter eiseniae]|uniref:Glyoxalase/bleomycin resistance protein/dioxygenase n=1 Tax=Verminephrobacter eiseniae (strain EF01-2) TaxID=391735 RepID=A1WPN3_VEREI|nr:VOC family protein [Verminephrobacter eiseniae]ABM59590.1 Glyoxalase/bleomycin resistance protein/dioxygenase [Verminephrobacter eiseniae EF01-2]MCW5285106.1 VOC family protein [Verminephrobacter eiseniae]MCW5302814.1 VOC family protein [Verminephrobacter eiseniae]MCW8180474.1 VOC family protein [Verminephrobacter eiseniae]MCW8191459.1 VOC family protein [Verminephrobacter eiseniae]